MKRLSILLATLIMGLSLNLSAQSTSRAQATDFTATDCHGNTIHLYDILDGGQYVVIDFFFLQCQPCQMTVGNVVQSYRELGCNQHDVFYMEVSPIDDNAACQTWIDTYGVEYPTIGTSGNGMSICQSYGVSGYPRLILISPDHEIVIDDIYPSSAQTVINELAAFGIEKHECDPTDVEENGSSTPSTGSGTSGTLSVYPNPAQDYVTVSGEEPCNVVIYNALGQKMDEFATEGQPVIIPTRQYPNGIYFVKAGEQTQRLVITH
ncbi:MAG: redoxin domain-containing protein [Bacteroidales bacterium]|nr:redoxin domain-containing protein [Bacteroidales bacterium]